MNDTQMAFYQGLRKDGTLSDFTIKCGGTTYAVHRVIVAAHSNYFKALFKGPFVENRRRLIELKDDDPSAVKLMIDYFYGIDYSKGYTGSTFTSRLLMHAAMYVIADKYDIQDLKKLAVSHTRQESRDSNLNEDDDPIEAIRLVYSGTAPSDQSLRTALIDYWLESNASMGSKEDLAHLIEEGPEFAADVLHSLLRL